jgi:hypothetical protein
MRQQPLSWHVGATTHRRLATPTEQRTLGRWRKAVALLPLALLTVAIAAAELNDWRARNRLVERLNARAEHWAGENDTFADCYARLPPPPGWDDVKKRVTDPEGAEAWSTLALGCAWPLPTRVATPATSNDGERGHRWWVAMQVIAFGTQRKLARLDERREIERAARTCAETIALRARFDRSQRVLDYSLMPVLNMCERLAAEPAAELERIAARGALTTAPTDGQLVVDWSDQELVDMFAPRFTDEQSQRLAVPFTWSDFDQPWWFNLVVAATALPLEHVFSDFFEADLEAPVHRGTALDRAASEIEAMRNPAAREEASFFRVSVPFRVECWHRRVDQLRAIAETDPGAPMCTATEE